jgi:predicted Fe-Mo cluster-binding NifX family protein
MIAVAADGQLVAEHFSRASSFVLADVGPDGVRNVRVIAARAPGMPSPVHQLLDCGVQMLLANRIGEQATKKLEAAGVAVLSGKSGPIEKVLQGASTYATAITGLTK